MMRKGQTDPGLIFSLFTMCDNLGSSHIFCDILHLNMSFLPCEINSLEAAKDWTICPRNSKSLQRHQTMSSSYLKYPSHNDPFGSAARCRHACRLVSLHSRASIDHCFRSDGVNVKGKTGIRHPLEKLQITSGKCSRSRRIHSRPTQILERTSDRRHRDFEEQLHLLSRRVRRIEQKGL